MLHLIRPRRVPLAALGLSLMLLIDGLAVAPGHSVLGAQDDSQEADGGKITSATTSGGEAVACAQGFVEVETVINMSLHGVTETGKGAVAVGYARRSSPGHNGVRAPASIVNRGGEWTRVAAISPGDEDGLMAVSWGAGSQTWAVGFTTDGPEIKPLAMKFDGSEWKVDKPSVNASVGVLIDVTILGDGSPFAVGYRMDDQGRRKALVLRKNGSGWRSMPMRVGLTESLTLTGVSTDKHGGIWAVGHGGVGKDVQAKIWNRDGNKWRKHALPKLKGESVLTDVIATYGDSSWAVGYHKVDGVSKALVLHWNGKKWKKFTAPRWDSNDVILNAVSSDPAGGFWVVGAAWNDENKAHEAIAAWWDGRAWNEVSGRTSGAELHEATGSLSGEGWAVGRSNSSGQAVRVCTPPQAGIFGSPEPSGTTEAATAKTLLHDHDDEFDEFDDYDADDLEYELPPDAAADNRKAGKSAVKTKNQIGDLPIARALPSLVAKDVAKPAGVFQETGSYDAVVDDFDGDDTDDIFIGRHGRKGQLLLNRSGVFQVHEPLKMGSVDRHGCTSADIDGSGLPDLYCAAGGKRGSGLKSNELWLDPGGPAPVEVASLWGVADTTGRGRLAAFLEAKKQQAVKLVVTNTPTRVDGFPSLTRLFRTKSEGGFEAKPPGDVAARLGARAMQDADFDSDGREDLLLVTGGPQTARAGSTRLYRNTKKGLIDVTKKLGIKSFDEMDAELVDLNGDKKLDLVQLSEDKLRVSIFKNGSFEKVYEAQLTGGKAIAGGDVNGDGRDDLYIVRSDATKNVPDVMLVNRGGGRTWVSMVIPQVSAGVGDDAFAIDHDGNGREDFLVLNGHNARGPVQLIAFYRR